MHPCSLGAMSSEVMILAVERDNGLTGRSMVAIGRERLATSQHGAVTSARNPVGLPDLSLTR